MNTKSFAVWSSVFLFALALLFAGVLALRAQTGGSADAVAAITKLENDSVTADLANDKSFYEKNLTDDATSGDSTGKWYTKADIVKMFDDSKNNSTKSEKLSDLKVRVYGNAAVATYTDTYDAMIMGKHVARTVIETDTFVKVGGAWKGVANHSSEVK